MLKNLGVSQDCILALEILRSVWNWNRELAWQWLWGVAVPTVASRSTERQGEAVRLYSRKIPEFSAQIYTHLKVSIGLASFQVISGKVVTLVHWDRG